MLQLVKNDSPRGEHLTVEEFDDLEMVGEAIRAGARVTAELRGSDELVRRAIDFMSGLIYALDGTMDKVAERVFLLAPPDQAGRASA